MPVLCPFGSHLVYILLLYIYDDYIFQDLHPRFARPGFSLAYGQSKTLITIKQLVLRNVIVSQSRAILAKLTPIVDNLAHMCRKQMCFQFGINIKGIRHDFGIPGASVCSSGDPLGHPERHAGVCKYISIDLGWPLGPSWDGLWNHKVCMYETCAYKCMCVYMYVHGQ